MLPSIHGHHICWSHHQTILELVKKWQKYQSKQTSVECVTTHSIEIMQAECITMHNYTHLWRNFCIQTDILYCIVKSKRRKVPIVPPGLKPPPPLLGTPPPPSFWSKFKKLPPSFWEPSELVHINCKKLFKMKVLRFVLN